MIEWLRRVFRQSEDDKRRRFFAMIDELNAEAGGGGPQLVNGRLGQLALRSQTLALGDPRYMPSVTIPGFATDQVTISARLSRHPTGTASVVELLIDTESNESVTSWRKVGELGIDSSKTVVADKADIDEHWTQTGMYRIGVIGTARDNELLMDLERRFKLRTVQVNRVRAEVVGPVSVSLEQEIEAYLKSVPRYAKYPFMHFRVQTNNSFERALFMPTEWGFLPVGNKDVPLMFACGTGRGDGCYDVNCGFAGETPVRVRIRFIDEVGDVTGED